MKSIVLGECPGRGVAFAAESLDLERCEALASTDFSRIQDVLTQIREATLVSPSSSAGGTGEIVLPR